MGLRELAQKDAAHTIEGKQAGNTVFSLADLSGHSWEITGFIGDIGYSVDTEGNRIAGRTVFASYIADRVKINGEIVTPAQNWCVAYTDLGGKTYNARVAFAEPDRTIGITRLYLTLGMDTDVKADGE
ncbi:MAG: hypothetical protein J6T20_04830 [Treponema sp.]|nr:hypothetical protein [Treponema sp.]